MVLDVEGLAEFVNEKRLEAALAGLSPEKRDEAVREATEQWLKDRNLSSEKN